MTMLALVLSLAQLDPRAGQGQQPRGDESVLATYDLRAVMPRWDASPTWSQSLLVPPAASPRQELPSLDDTLAYGDLASFELLDLLTQVLGDELRREGREFLVEGNVLTVLAPSALQEQVRSILDGLESALAGTIPVRVDILALPENGGELPPAGLVSEDEAGKLVTALVGRGAQQRSYTLELSAGRTARTDAFRRVPFLFDYDIQIAQGMLVYYPVMSEAHDGTRIAMRGLPVTGGLVLSTLLQRSDLTTPMAKRPLVLKGMLNHSDKGPTEFLDGPDSLQSPELLLRGLAFDTFLPDGKALALTMEAALGETHSRELVLLRRQGGATSAYVARPIPRTNRTLIALDAELFRPARLRADAAPWTDAGVAHPNLVASLDGEVSGFLLEWLKAHFNVWRRFGPWILIVTDPAWDRDAAAQLDRLVKSLRPTTSLRDVAIDLRGPGRPASNPVRVRLPLLAGSTAGIVIARGTTAVTGYDVEVANGAAGADPFVSSVFDGLALALSIEDTTCEASGMAQLFDAPMTSLDPGYPPFGAIDRPEPRVLRFDERVVLPEGRPGPVRIGGGSERGEPPGLSLEIEVSPPSR